MNSIATHILALPSWVALVVVFAFPALESSAFVGFVFPGEIALLLGGVIAYEGRVPLAAVLACGIAGAIVGDSVGYAVGRRYGRRLLDGTVGRFVKSSHLDRAEVYLAERGGKAVFYGRFTAALRVLIPGLAGMAGLRYRTFLIYNVAGAVGWGTMSVLLGYVGGSSWQHVQHIASRVGLVVLALVVVVLVGRHLVRRTSPERLARLSDTVTSSPVLGRARARFPRTTSWLIARLDPGVGTGLGLTTAVAVGAAATWIFLGVSQDVVAHEELALLDPRINGWMVAHRVVGLGALFKAVAWLGATAVTVPVLAGVGGVLARLRRSWVPVVACAAVYGTAVLLGTVVGRLIRRQRPPAVDWLASASGWSYPSGHTTQAVAAWGIVVLLLSAHASPRVRLLVGSAGTAIALLVAISPIYLGVHWTTDVIGAASMAVAVLAAWIVVQRSLLTPRTTTLGDEPSR